MSEPLDMDAVEADEETAANLRATAVLVFGYYQDLRALGAPDALSIGVVRDWHFQYISPDGVEWEPDDDA